MICQSGGQLDVGVVEQNSLFFVVHDTDIDRADEIVDSGPDRAKHRADQLIAGGLAQQVVKFLVIKGGFGCVCLIPHFDGQLHQPGGLSGQDTVGGQAGGFALQTAAQLADLEIVGLTQQQHHTEAGAEILFQIAGEKVARAVYAGDKAHQAHGTQGLPHGIAAHPQKLRQFRSGGSHSPR